MKILQATWSTNKDGTIGFVLYEDSYGKRHLRCAPVMGVNQDADIIYVVAWGSRIPADLKKMIEKT